MFVGFSYWLVGLVAQNSEIPWSKNKIDVPILK
jgi:hypothetical protein